MKDHERRTRQDIAKVVKHEKDLPEYFREQAGYYRRKKLQRDLILAADVIYQLQLDLKDVRESLSYLEESHKEDNQEIIDLTNQLAETTEGDRND